MERENLERHHQYLIYQDYNIEPSTRKDFQVKSTN
jgi:hypothetical protein